MQIDSKPIIIGAGISGMTVSRALSNAQIPHILIGSPPDDTPRPGESLNLEGTLLILKQFPDLAHHFYRKSLGTAYLGEHVVSCSFLNDHHPMKNWVFRITGDQRPDELLHVDRIGFDRDLYARVSTDPCCTVIDEMVSEVVYNAESDRIERLHLANGDTLVPRFVFDATNSGAVIGRAAHLNRQSLSIVHRAVYTHYRTSDGQPHADYYATSWEYATSILGLYPDIDGIHAIAWCIPLGSYVSVGVTTLNDANADAYPEDALLTIVEQAYRRRGICYRDRYPETTVIKSHPNQYFVHERAYGANWLLVGSAYVSVCWIAGAGIGSAFAAADIAAPILDNPQKCGALYQRHLDHLVDMNNTINWFVEAPYDVLTCEAIVRQMDQAVLANARRMLMASRLKTNRLRQAVCDLMLYFSHKMTFIRDACRAHYVPNYAEQTDILFTHWQ